MATAISNMPSVVSIAIALEKRRRRSEWSNGVIGQS